MKKYVVLTMLACAGAWAADYHPMDVKTGQWETTAINHMSGLPPIPAEALSRMTPEQRAQVEAAMKATSGKPITSKSCLSKKELAEGWNGGQQRVKDSCKTVLTTSTASKQEIHVTCAGEGMKGGGTITIQRIDSEHVRGTGQIVAAADSNAGQPMNMNYEFTAKWIGPACTEK